MHAAPMRAYSPEGCSIPTARAGQGLKGLCHRLQAADASMAALCCFQLVLSAAGCQLTHRRLPFAGSCQSGTASCSMPLPVAVQVGPGDHVICALSGGVDSTVAATLVHKVLGDRLHCVFVDNGLLRYKVRSGSAWTPAGSWLSQEHCLTPSEWHLASRQCLPLPNACHTATHHACKTAQLRESPAP